MCFLVLQFLEAVLIPSLTAPRHKAFAPSASIIRSSITDSSASFYRPLWLHCTHPDNTGLSPYLRFLFNYICKLLLLCKEHIYSSGYRMCTSLGDLILPTIPKITIFIIWTRRLLRVKEDPVIITAGPQR